MKMDETPKNVVLILDGDKKRASIARGVDISKRSRSIEDHPISGYAINFAINGGYVVEVSYEGTQQTDFLAFATKEELLNALDTILK